MALPAGIICSTEDYERSRSDHSIYCLHRSDTIGVVLTIEAGFISLLAIVYVFGLIARNVFWRFRHMPTSRLRIFHQPMDLLMFSLLLADSVQAVGMVLSLKWVANGKTEVGEFCKAQAIVKILGATTVALSTTGITIYTFIAVWMQKSISSMRSTFFVVSSFWLFGAFIVLLALYSNNDPSKPGFINPTPFWCWVNSSYVVWRLVAEYLWMWTALLISVVVYISLYFWTRGNIELDPQAWWKPRFKWASERDRQIVAVRRRSLAMLAYPIVYCFSIMPLSAVRWTVYAQEANTGKSSVPPAATFAAVTIFGLSGFLNCILLVTTRRTSGLFGDLMYTAPSRAPIIFFRNERDPRVQHRVAESQAKSGRQLYDEMFHIDQVHAM